MSSLSPPPEAAEKVLSTLASVATLTPFTKADRLSPDLDTAQWFHSYTTLPSVVL